jgi:hypothetical protein
MPRLACNTEASNRVYRRCLFETVHVLLQPTYAQLRASAALRIAPALCLLASTMRYAARDSQPLPHKKGFGASP